MKISLGNYPTLIETNNELIRLLGFNLDLKREDLAGTNIEGRVITAGVKIRMIEYLFAHAIENGYELLVLDGMAQSNCLAAIAELAPYYGLKTHCIIKEKPTIPCGNYQKTLAYSTHVSHIDSTDPAIVAQLKEEIRARYAQPSKVLLVPTGATMSETLRGSMDIGKEIAQSGKQYDHVFVPHGTGCLIYGLTLDARINHRPWKVHGICIDEYPIDEQNSFFRKLSIPLVGDSGELLEESLALHTEAIGEGYGKFSSADKEMAENIEKKTGLWFEPSYGLKCLKGIIALRERLPGTYLMIHTGGNHDRGVLNLE
jgi:1-aminocyclopropane-1-carboxylate deaminase/D-cysteine desulfhydrase-like pyridoxal-dependent ACC family enzyme